MTLTMYDSVNIAQLPYGADAYAGYVNGLWPTYNSLKAKFPAAHILSIAVTVSADAECLDVEKGDAVNTDAPAWVKRQIARGIERPVLYTSVSNVNALVAELRAAKIDDDNYRLWSAHYNVVEHICGPTTCKQTNMSCDGTQWTNVANGINLDQSVLNNDFFGSVVAVPQPVLIGDLGNMQALNQMILVKLGTNGNGYMDIGVPFSSVVGLVLNSSDPGGPGGVYPEPAILSALGLASGVTRVVVVNGTPGTTVGVKVSYLQ